MMKDNNDQIAALRDIIAHSVRLCVFTGAGISCPSGIPDFRSATGLYSQPGLEGYTPEQIISHDCFTEKPELFYRFYKSKMLYPDAKPNAAHLYFARLESAARHVSIVTQNIDGLHQAAGSSDVAELHGSVYRNHCTRCGKSHTLDEIISSDGVPRCECGGIIKPDVVLYGEELDESVISHALDAIQRADTLVVVGTSLTVYPAAAFVRYFTGSASALINLSPTPFDTSAGIAVYGDAAEICGAL